MLYMYQMNPNGLMILQLVGVAYPVTSDPIMSLTYINILVFIALYLRLLKWRREFTFHNQLSLSMLKDTQWRISKITANESR